MSGVDMIAQGHYVGTNWYGTHFHIESFHRSPSTGEIDFIKIPMPINWIRVS